MGISADRLPVVLGCDAAGLDQEGNEVIVHAVIGDPGAGGGGETLDPRRSLLSERRDGTFAQQVAVPRRLGPVPQARRADRDLRCHQRGGTARFCEQSGARPVIDRVLPLAGARDGFAAMIAGDLFGKIVLVP